MIHNEMISRFPDEVLNNLRRKHYSFWLESDIDLNHFAFLLISLNYTVLWEDDNVVVFKECEFNSMTDHWKIREFCEEESLFEGPFDQFHRKNRSEAHTISRKQLIGLEVLEIMIRQ